MRKILHSIVTFFSGGGWSAHLNGGIHLEVFELCADHMHYPVSEQAVVFLKRTLHGANCHVPSVARSLAQRHCVVAMRVGARSGGRRDRCRRRSGRLPCAGGGEWYCLAAAASGLVAHRPADEQVGARVDVLHLLVEHVVEDEEEGALRDQCGAVTLCLMYSPRAL